jgi:hypothetical protein
VQTLILASVSTVEDISSMRPHCLSPGVLCANLDSCIEGKTQFVSRFDLPDRPAYRRDASCDASCPRWLFWSILANWQALPYLNRLAHLKLKNTNNLQANKWQIYAIAILAMPMSGHLIQIVQNDAISTTCPKKWQVHE